MTKSIDHYNYTQVSCTQSITNNISTYSYTSTELPAKPFIFSPLFLLFSVYLSVKVKYIANGIYKFTQGPTIFGTKLIKLPAGKQIINSNSTKKRFTVLQPQKPLTPRFLQVHRADAALQVSRRKGTVANVISCENLQINSASMV